MIFQFVFCIATYIIPYHLYYPILPQYDSQKLAGSIGTGYFHIKLELLFTRASGARWSTTKSPLSYIPLQ